MRVAIQFERFRRLVALFDEDRIGHLVVRDELLDQLFRFVGHANDDQSLRNELRLKFIVVRDEAAARASPSLPVFDKHNRAGELIEPLQLERVEVVSRVDL